jgi:hypothetical protein
MLTSMRALGVRSELTDTDPGHFQGAVETHEHPRSQPTDRTTLSLVMTGITGFISLALLLTAQFAALGVHVVAVAAIVACALLQKRVHTRDRVPVPSPNWHDRQLAEASARRR